MKLATKLESWLRRIVAGEIAKLDASLQREKSEIHAHLQLFDAQLEAFSKVVSVLSGAVATLDGVRENASLREQVKTLSARASEIVALSKQIHPNH